MAAAREAEDELVRERATGGVRTALAEEAERLAKEEAKEARVDAEEVGPVKISLAPCVLRAGPSALRWPMTLPPTGNGSSHVTVECRSAQGTRVPCALDDMASKIY
jgi:hypothetical protein